MQTNKNQSLQAALAGHNNSLGFLRLLFAVFVIISHSSALGGFGSEPLTDLSQHQTSLGSIAVLGFFPSAATSLRKVEFLPM